MGSSPTVVDFSFLYIMLFLLTHLYHFALNLLQVRTLTISYKGNGDAYGTQTSTFNVTNSFVNNVFFLLIDKILH